MKRLAGGGCVALAATATAAAAPAGWAPVPATVAPRAQTFFVAGHTRDTLVGIAARPGRFPEVTAIPGDLAPLKPGDLRAGVGSAVRVLRTRCGPNCFLLPQRALAGRALDVVVEPRVGKGSGQRLRLRLPARMPATASALLARANRQMSSVRAVRMFETLANGVTRITATFDFQAPDRMRYTTSAGSKAVVIGGRRWDWDGIRWKETPTPRIRVPVFSWKGAGSARLLGRARVDGIAVQVVAAFRPDAGYPAWFKVFVARDGRVRRAEMVAPAHFMVDRYERFGRASAIEPPG